LYAIAQAWSAQERGDYLDAGGIGQVYRVIRGISNTQLDLLARVAFSGIDGAVVCAFLGGIPQGNISKESPAEVDCSSQQDEQEGEGQCQLDQALASF